MYSFAERKLLDDVVHTVFSLKARGRLTEEEASKLIALNRMAEAGTHPRLFNLLRQVLVKPGLDDENEEIKAVIIQTIISSDLQNEEDIKLIETMITEIVAAAD